MKLLHENYPQRYKNKFLSIAIHHKKNTSFYWRCAAHFLPQSSILGEVHKANIPYYHCLLFSLGNGYRKT